MNMKKNIKLDSATIDLNSKIKTNSIVLNLADQIQDIAVAISRVDGSNDVATAKYDSVVGGYTSHPSLWSSATTWPTSSKPGVIPQPLWTSTATNFIVEDPKNSNPKTVDQSAHVPSSRLNFMEASLETVSVKYQGSKMGATGANIDEASQNIGYVVKFRDTTTHTLHSIFIDASLAANNDEAIKVAKTLIADPKNWDTNTNAATMKQFLDQQFLEVQNVHGSPNDVEKSQMSALSDTNVDPNGLHFVYSETSGDFSHLVGMSSKAMTTINVSEIKDATNGNSIQILVEENEQQNAIMTAVTTEYTFTGISTEPIDMSLLNDPDLITPELAQIFASNGVNEHTPIGLEAFIDVDDINTLLKENPLNPAPTLIRSSGANHGNVPAPNPSSANVYLPHININGKQVPVSQDVFAAFMKLQQLNQIVTKAPAGYPLYEFIKKLDFKFDVATGLITIDDSTNGKYGFSVDLAKSNLDFSTGTINIVYKQVVTPQFITPITLELKNVQGTTKLNLGNVIFNQATNSWTDKDITIDGTLEQGIHEPTELQQHHSTLTLVTDNNTKKLILTTDGSFKPVDNAQIKWVVDANNPHVWIGNGTTPEFANIMPKVANQLNIETHDVPKHLTPSGFKGLNPSGHQRVTNVVHKQTHHNKPAQKMSGDCFKSTI